MRASMWTAEFYRKSASQCADPRGSAGFVALTAMALKNGAQNRAALDALDIRRGDSIIEIGCGPGLALREALRRVGKDGFVAGIDQSATAAHYAAHSVHSHVLKGRAITMRANANDLPFRDSFFDRAFAVNTFQYWPDPARALREISRVLAPSGRLVITQRAATVGGAGLDRVAQACALMKAQGWRLLDERAAPDGARLMAVSVIAVRPE